LPFPANLGELGGGEGKRNPSGGSGRGTNGRLSGSSSGAGRDTPVLLDHLQKVVRVGFSENTTGGAGGWSGVVRFRVNLEPREVQDSSAQMIRESMRIAPAKDIPIMADLLSAVSV
jgi:hypothetical protein